MSYLLAHEIKIDCLAMKENNYWVFGYGSIIWDHEEYNPLKIMDAKLIGARRSFNKKSIVSRGTRQNPGLALGLVYGEETIGKAFHVNSEAYTLMLKREKGYIPIKTPNEQLKVVDFAGKAIKDCVVFFPDFDSPNFLEKSVTILEKVEIIKLGEEGKRGNARDYLRETHSFLTAKGIKDEEVESLFNMVFNIE